MFLRPFSVTFWESFWTVLADTSVTFWPPGLQGPPRVPPRVPKGPPCGHFGSFWTSFWIIWGLRGGSEGVVLDLFGTHFGVFLASFWTSFVPIEASTTKISKCPRGRKNATAHIFFPRPSHRPPQSNRVLSVRSSATAYSKCSY